MKKIYFLLIALVMSISAFAQSAGVTLPSQITFSPYDEDGEFLPSTEQTIHVTMDAVPSVPVTIMYVTGNGFGMDMKTDTISVTEPSFDINLTRENWGVPYNEMFFLNLVVTFTHEVDGEMEYYLNEDGEPVAFPAMYITMDTGAPALVMYSPNNEWNGVTFDRAYEYGECKLYYTKAVGVSGGLGTIQYYADGEPLLDEPKQIGSYTEGWSDMDGLYVISFNYADEDFSAEDLSKIVIEITGVSAGNETIVLDNSTNSPQKRIVKNKKGTSSGLAVAYEPMNVYSVQGSLVKKDATDLSGLLPGLYIVDGKKVVVK